LRCKWVLFYPAPVLAAGGRGARFFGLLPVGKGKPPGLSRGGGRLVKEPVLKGFAAMRTVDFRLFGLLHAGPLTALPRFCKPLNARESIISLRKSG
jgi:hypothetical protein